MSVLPPVEESLWNERKPRTVILWPSLQGSYSKRYFGENFAPEKSSWEPG